MATASARRRLDVGVESELFAANPNDVGARQNLRPLEPNAVHVHAVRAEVPQIVAAVNRGNAGVFPRDLILAHDDAGARVAPDHDPLGGHRVLLAIDERHEPSASSGGGPRGAGSLGREDRRDVCRRDERRVPRLGVVGEQQFFACDLHLVPVNQRRGVDERNSIHAHRGATTAARRITTCGIVREFDDRLHASAGISIDTHVHIFARAKSILAGTERKLFVVDRDDRHDYALAQRSKVRDRGTSEARDAGVGERSYRGRNYPIAPRAGKRHAPACNASFTAPACSR